MAEAGRLKFVFSSEPLKVVCASFNPLRVGAGGGMFRSFFEESPALASLSDNGSIFLYYGTGTCSLYSTVYSLYSRIHIQVLVYSTVGLYCTSIYI